MPSGGGCMTPPRSPLPRVRVSTKALRSKLSAIARRRSGSLNGGMSRFIITLRLTLTGTRLQIASGAWFFTSLTTGTCKKIRRGHVELAGDEGQNPGRHVLDDRVLDTVEIGTVLLPIIGISGYFDRFVRLDFDEFERAGADRMTAHVARRNMARIDRRKPGREQRNKGGLRPLQMEGDLVITVGCHFFEISVPGFTRIDAELLARFAGE